MHITLYRKYRPKDFDEMAGEKEIVQTIKNSLRSNRLAHAYLFTGPRGVGKTTIARLIAKGINCLENGITDTPCNRCENCLEISAGNFLDLIEIDAASNRGIDEIRQLKENINYSPAKGRKKVYIIDEVHMLTKEAFNALLKTLEEPPEHVVFILATTEPDKILPTIISRCQRYDFKTINYKDMREKLLYITEQENVSIDEASLMAVYENSGGSMRDSISTLERLIINSGDSNITIEKTEEVLGITSARTIDLFIEKVLERDREGAVEILEDIWKNGVDIELFFKDLAKRSKERIIKETLNIDWGLKIIEIVYEVLSKFRYEEDKKLVGYVVLNKLTERPAEVERVIERVIETVKEEKTEEASHSERGEEVETTLEDVKRMWDGIVTEAKKAKITFGAFLVKAYPKKVKNGVLTIGFPQEFAFSKDKMESEPYRTIFLDVVRKFTKNNIRIVYEVQELKTKEKESEEDFSKKIMDFFGGEII